MKTLILGGYGNFGARIARALPRDAQVEVLIGGRDAGQATALAAQLAPTARGIAIDARHDGFAQTLRSLGVQLLVHTAGPFQRQDYAVAQAAAGAGAHYIDLADGRRFVCDFKAHNDTTFRQADRCAISGASTVPALSSAVVDHLAAGWQRIDRIETCIAPAQSAPRGVATTAAVLSYCGEPIAVWREGRWQHRFGWANPQWCGSRACSHDSLPSVTSRISSCSLSVTTVCATLAFGRRSRCVWRNVRWHVSPRCAAQAASHGPVAGRPC